MKINILLTLVLTISAFGSAFAAPEDFVLSVVLERSCDEGHEAPHIPEGTKISLVRYKSSTKDYFEIEKKLLPKKLKKLFKGMKLEYISGGLYPGVEVEYCGEDTITPSTKMLAPQAVVTSHLSYEHLRGQFTVKGDVHTLLVYQSMVDGKQHLYLNILSEQGPIHGGHAHHPRS